MFKFCAFLVCIPLAAQMVVKQQGYVPFADAPIFYRSEILDDPVARLERRLEAGQASLAYDKDHGYLRSVLAALRVDASSQTLVFSKTSFQYPRISPEKPRALYFNDDVYVGEVRDAPLLEFISFDPLQGAIFYVLDNHPGERARFERAVNDCIQCHVAASTRGVPGVLLRSVHTRPSGAQAGGTPSFITGQESRFADRWGGWYVSGFLGSPVHLGLPVADANFYLAASSDVVAHLVLAHQTQMHNLITQLNYQTRLAQFAVAQGKKSEEQAQRQIEKVSAQVVGYLLFANEAPIEGVIDRASVFAKEFSARGPRDSSGRSLRDFDLDRRIFKYRCSYLIYSEAFDALPEPAKATVYRQLFDVLSGRDESEEFSSLSAGERRAIFEILVSTKPGLPEEWKAILTQARAVPYPGKPTTITSKGR